MGAAPSDFDTDELLEEINRRHKHSGKRAVLLTDPQFLTICGAVAESDEREGGINQQGIFGPWDEIREIFPTSEFKEKVPEADPDAVFEQPVSYLEEAGY